MRFSTIPLRQYFIFDVLWRVNNNHPPLISCLCVSSDRPHFLRKTIHYFQQQTYSHKELVIVSLKFQTEYKQIVDSANSPNLKYFFLENDRKLTLGELRNYSIEMSAGEYFCNWDDDDWYHRNRLEIQLQAAIRSYKPASVMPYLVMFHSAKRQAYLTHPYPMPPTILCKKEIVSDVLRYPSMDRGEDSHFLLRLVERNLLVPVIDPTLYIYVFHGANTWNEKHFDFLFGQANKLSTGLSQLVEDVLNHKYSYERSSELLRSPEIMKEFNYFPPEYLKASFANAMKNHLPV
jgi:glycosyltransferase involved in cell wall biosynthesis